MLVVTISGVEFLYRRSKAKAVKNRIRGLIFNSSFHDMQRCETVCQISRMDILALLTEPVVEVGDVPDVEKGEVLLDSRGTGSFQRMVK